MEVSGQNDTRVALRPAKEPHKYLIEAWVGSWTGQEILRRVKLTYLDLQGFTPRSNPPVAYSLQKLHYPGF
jgi:hypothetical protein